MAASERFFSFNDFLSANKNKKINEVDYLHAAFKIKELHPDILICFIRLLFPDFKVVDDRVFVDSHFDQSVYDQYVSENLSGSRIQFWINLVEITCIFEDMDIQSAINIGSEIVKAWNVKIKHQANIGYGVARLIHDQEAEEVYITID